jgi:hypothetical protein
MAGVLAVVGTAVRLVAGHWPVLLSLFMAGLIGRELVMLAAVEVSDVHAVAGALVLVLAPIATLTAMVLMLRAVRTSLPALRAAVPGPGHRRLLDHLGSVLVPFLAVYASAGYLRRDTSEYSYRVWEDDTLNNPEFVANPGSVDPLDRLPFSLGLPLVLVVVVAVVLRWLLGRWEAARRRPWLGIPGAYLEVIWITLVVVAVNLAAERAAEWLTSRRVVRGLREWWSEFAGDLGGVGEPVRAAASWLQDQVTYVDAVLVLPIAWLTVGTVVFGRRMAEPALPRVPGRAVRAWVRLPRPARRIVGGITADLRDRFLPLLRSVALLWRTGPGPMLIFCLAFLAAQSLGIWLWELERRVVGPQEPYLWFPLSDALRGLNEGIATMVLVCLLAAAVDRVVRAGGPAADGQPPAAPPVAGTAGSRAYRGSSERSHSRTASGWVDSGVTK